MTPEEKASLEKVLELKSFRELHEVVTSLSQDPNVLQYFKNDKTSQWLASQLLEVLGDVFIQIDEKAQSFKDMENNHLNYTSRMLDFLYFQEYFRAYEETLSNFQEILDYKNLPEKYHLIKENPLLISHNITTLFANLTGLNIEQLDHKMIKIRDKLINTGMVSPAGAPRYLIDYLFVNSLFQLEQNRHAAAENKFSTADYVRHFTETLFDIYACNYTIPGGTDEIMLLAIGQNMHDLNTLFNKVVLTYPGSYKSPQLDVLKEHFYRNILSLQLPVAQEGFIYKTRGDAVRWSYEDMGHIRSNFVSYIDPAFKGSVLSVKAITDLKRQPIGHLIWFQEPYEFCTVTYDQPSIMEWGNGESEIITERRCDIHLKVAYEGLPIKMTTYVFPLAPQETSRLYINQLTNTDFGEYQYYAIPSLKVLEGNQLSTSSINLLKPGQLIPANQHYKSSLFIAECIPDPQKTDRLKLHRVLHLFDIASYKK